MNRAGRKARNPCGAADDLKLPAPYFFYRPYMKLIYTTEPFMQDTPAAVNRDTGIIYINPVLYATLTPFQQKFVLQHELGHYRLQTSSELKADAYAFAQLAGTEFRSLKQSLGCISEILGKDNPTRKRRYKALYKRVLAYDYLHYGNKLAKEEFERLYPGEDIARYGKLEKFGTNKSVQIINATGNAITDALDSMTLFSTTGNKHREVLANTVVMAAVCCVVIYVSYKLLMT